ncbi:MAG: Fic family protein [Nitrospinae bacterium]|nr:Fic family protein [Nitrospinota bacterium]
MNKSFKYDTSSLADAQFEPGSRGQVLKNLPGIKKKREIDGIESAEQERVLNELVVKVKVKHRFTARDISNMHKAWLGSIYAWAGSYRNVNIGKGGFSFAAAQHIPQLMRGLEKGPLKKYTPCNFSSTGEVVKALAVVHTELVLIHPFREGNGRLARILAILMALQAGLPPLDFAGIKGRMRQEYFAAVRAGVSRNYRPMEQVFRSVIRLTLKNA